METIPLFRAAHLYPHLELLRKIGAPVERGLSQAKLPVNLGHQPDTLLPLHRALDFLTAMLYSQGVDDFELRAVHTLKVENLNTNIITAMDLAPTLYSALNAFCNLVAYESNYTRFWIETDDNNAENKAENKADKKSDSKAKLCTHFNASENPRSIRHSEWNQIMVPLAIVRAFVGPGWCPSEIGLQSSLPIGQFAMEQFPNTRFLFGQKAAYFELPRAMLSLSHSNVSPVVTTQLITHTKADNQMDFPASLKKALRSYLGDGCPDVKLAADIAGTSVRTLQRKLKHYGVSYSDLVQQTQFESATELLKNPDIRTLDIAYAVGYEDPSNFARAFRRIAGVSPREYRVQLCLQ